MPPVKSLLTIDNTLTEAPPRPDHRFADQCSTKPLHATVMAGENTPRACASKLRLENAPNGRNTVISKILAKAFIHYSIEDDGFDGLIQKGETTDTMR